jgi:hypothetical protein
MLFKEIIAVYFEIHTKLCAQNSQFVNVKAGGTHTYHCALKREMAGICPATLWAYSAQQ